jgi:hypothetical protein
MSTIETLLEFPALLQLAVEQTPEALWQTRGRDGAFALVEQACHLADLEHEGFCFRIERILDETDPLLPDFPGAEMARLRHYIDRPLPHALARFRTTREANVARLRNVHGDEWSRRGIQEGIGEVTLVQMPELMLLHDISHAHELLTLLPELGVAVPESLTAFASRDPLARSA